MKEMVALSIYDGVTKSLLILLLLLLFNEEEKNDHAKKRSSVFFGDGETLVKHRGAVQSLFGGCSSVAVMNFVRVFHHGEIFT